MAKSVKEKLAAAVALLASLPATIAQLEAEAAREFDPQSLVPGERLRVNYARGGKENIVEVKVLGVKVPEGKGSTFIVAQIGEGVDTQVVSVVPSQVLERLDQPKTDDETLADAS